MTLCACGCGWTTNVASVTRLKAGHVKGQHYKYARGHKPRPIGPLKTYAQVCRSGKNVALHRERAVKALGHALPKGSIVHHADGSRSEDSPLVICQSQGYHNELHARMRVQRAGGNPWTDAICPTCETVKALDAFCKDSKRANGRHWQCKSCRSTQRRVA